MTKKALSAMIGGLLCLLIVVGSASAAMTAAYTVAGTVSGSQGRVSQDIDVSGMSVGNHTSWSGYSSSMSGFGDMQIASMTSIVGQETSGQIGVILGRGQVTGTASNTLTQIFVGENVTPEGSTLDPDEIICIDESPEELEFQNQYCEEASSSSTFIIKGGQAGISTLTTIPRFSSTLTNDLVFEGNGTAISSGEYLTITGQNFTADDVKEFTGRTRMSGVGLKFGSTFEYNTLHG